MKALPRCMVALLAFGGTACGEFVDAEARLDRDWGGEWRRWPVSAVSDHLTAMAESLPEGGAIHLPAGVDCGMLDFRGVADGVQISGGSKGTLVLGGEQKGIELLFCGLDLQIEEPMRRASGLGFQAGGAALPVAFRSELFNERVEPLSGLVAMFCEGGIRIRHDVNRCAWICGTNAFGRRTVTADARVDNSLFLWFGINWPFQDYNAHLDPRNAGKDWVASNTQMHLDLKGGGQGTRFYLMVETNYGNPGPGVILENAKGAALYHGTTERASSQGPGVYHLKNCERVQLGLRGINAFSPVVRNPRAPQPLHDLTIEGGRGNILHAVRCAGHAMEETLVSDDPELQLWSCSLQYDATGLELPGVFKFAVTPGDHLPDGDWIRSNEGGFSAYADWQLASIRGQFGISGEAAGFPGDLRQRFVERFRRGRFHDVPLDASREITLAVGRVDVTVAGNDLPAVPAPPDLPRTAAPRLARPIEFTRAEDFGRRLIDAGADPTGERASDDAFSEVMYGMPRRELQQLLDECNRLDGEYRAAREAGRRDLMTVAEAGIRTAMVSLGASRKVVGSDGSERLESLKREALHIPAGRFRLDHSLVMVGHDTIFGAGPERTVLFTDNREIAVIRRQGPSGGGTIANFTVEGGKTGLAFLGADHDDPVSPTQQAYVAGSNLFRLTFRNQVFAGIWVGNENPGVMGGAEHDQNKYVQLTFENTGDYGIYMNQSMLDKWLCLHGVFQGQRKAGIRVPFNNVFKGAVIGCRFQNIDGPGLDCSGMNPGISYPPNQVMIDECEFIECGSTTEAALEMGHATLSALTHSRIVTRGKEIFCGLRTAAQILDEVEVRAKVRPGNAAVQLRAVRDISTGRTNGHTLRFVNADGPVSFVNDSDRDPERFEATLLKLRKQHQLRGEPGELARPRLDSNPQKHVRPPANGWLHPFFFHGCRFGLKSYDHHLVNVDPGRNVILREIELPRQVSDGGKKSPARRK